MPTKSCQIRRSAAYTISMAKKASSREELAVE